MKNPFGFGQSYDPKNDDDPEDKSWEMAGDNPQLPEQTSEVSSAKRQTTQPYRRPTFLDELAGMSD